METFSVGLLQTLILSKWKIGETAGHSLHIRVEEWTEVIHKFSEITNTFKFSFIVVGNILYEINDTLKLHINE
jgi:hypothetical protein